MIAFLCSDYVGMYIGLGILINILNNRLEKVLRMKKDKNILNKLFFVNLKDPKKDSEQAKVSLTDKKKKNKHFEQPFFSKF